MLRPKEISEKMFDKTLGFGYRMDNVDDYLKEVAQSMVELYKVNADLESKLEILAEKLTEYREDEESLRSAILSSQKLGDSVIRESKTRAEIIMRDATIKAESMINNARRQIEKEHEGLEYLQREVATFKNRLLALYRQHLEVVSGLPGEVEQENRITNKSSKITNERAQAQSQDHTDPLVNTQAHAYNLSDNTQDTNDKEEELNRPSPERTPALDDAVNEAVKAVVGVNDDRDEQLGKVVAEEKASTKTLKQSIFQSIADNDDDDDDDVEEGDVSFFKKSQPSMLGKDTEMKFGEAFKIKRNSAFPNLKK